MSNNTTPQPTSTGDDWLTPWMLTIIGRNHYYRAAASLVAGALWFVLFPLLTVVFGVLAVVSLVIAIYKDAASYAFVRRSPTATELLQVSSQPEWTEKRKQLISFPFSLSDRDEKIVFEGQSTTLPNPLLAMSVIGETLERSAINTFGDSVRCFQLKRFYDNYPKGQLYPLPVQIQNGNQPTLNSSQSFCFCQRRRERFLPYLVLVYVHIAVEGQWLKSRIYVHGFCLSTWFGQDDERLKSTTLPYDVLQLWNEALARYIQTNHQSNAHTNAHQSSSGQKTQQGRTTR